MTRHDERLRLKHMLTHAQEAVKMARGKQRLDLDQERMLELALVRLIEIIGEAATRVSELTKARYPIIPWTQIAGMRNRLVHGSRSSLGANSLSSTQIAGMRNRLVHGYDQVDLDVHWDTVQDDLPSLIAELRKILLSEQVEQD